MAKEYRLNSECERFIQYLTQQKKSENTCLAYRQDLFYLFSSVNKSPITISEEEIESFLYQSKSNATFKRRKSSYSKFFWWLRVKAKLRQDNPIENIETIENVEVKPIKHLVPEQMKAVKQAALNNKKTSTHFRDVAIISMLMQCMLRESELRALNLSDVDFKTGLLYINNSKGNKSRKFPVPESTLKDIKNYIENERVSHPEALFTSKTGKRICRTLVVDCVKKYYNQVGCGNLSTHSGRHSSITAMLMSGKPMSYVAKCAGHSSIVTTQKYFGLIDQQLIDNRIELL